MTRVYFEDEDIAELVQMIEAVPGCYHSYSSYEDDSQNTRIKTVFSGWSPSLHKIEINLNGEVASGLSIEKLVAEQIDNIPHLLEIQKARADKAHELGLDHPSESFELSDPAMQTLHMSRNLVELLIEEGLDVVDMIQDEIATMNGDTLYRGYDRIDNQSYSLIEESPGHVILNMIRELPNEMLVMGPSLLVRKTQIESLPHVVRATFVGRTLDQFAEGCGPYAKCVITEISEISLAGLGSVAFEDHHISLNEIIEICDKNGAS